VDSLSLESAGKWLALAGLILTLVGGLIWLIGRYLPGLNQLPGAIRIHIGGLICIFPLLASIVLSLVLTVVLNIVLRLLKR